MSSYFIRETVRTPSTPRDVKSSICKVSEQYFDIKEKDKKWGYLDDSFVNEGRGKGTVRKNDKNNHTIGGKEEHTGV
jgi:hypothetical protein